MLALMLALMLIILVFGTFGVMVYKASAEGREETWEIAHMSSSEDRIVYTEVRGRPILVFTSDIARKCKGPGQCPHTP